MKVPSGLPRMQSSSLAALLSELHGAQWCRCTLPLLEHRGQLPADANMQNMLGTRVSVGTRDCFHFYFEVCPSASS